MRPSIDSWVLAIAGIVATRGTCARRRVGCVLTDARGRVLATGYNGVARGMPHCDEGHPCAGAGSPSGENLNGCEAVHAEQSALTQCRDPDLIHACYVTISPCVSCVKLLLNTGCRKIVFREAYARDASALWIKLGREWTCLRNL